MSKKNQTESNNIRVVCRCRPLNKLEIEQGGEQCVKILSDTNIQVQSSGEEQPHTFSFDKIFPSETRQIDVFQEVGYPVLQSIMSGINATVFAYGQTSSGKTHTMEGKHDDPEYMGLIPRMMEKLFEMIAEAPSSIEFSIKASFLEIYNEKIHDLLDTNKTNLNVKEDKLRGIFVQDATEAFVIKAADMMKVMRKGAENRSVAATRMNERSSRSHSIFLLTLIQKNTETETSRLSKLYFVDLAGSEKISKTNVSGQQLEEAKNINKSLTCLGIVINSLSEKKDHIPYRDSKLTRILQESIGGNSKTTLIIACSMCSYNDKETVGTLRFGQRAKSIKNQAKVNEEKSAKELMQLLAKAENTIKYKDEIISALQLQLGQEGITPNMNIAKPSLIDEGDKKIFENESEQKKVNQSSGQEQSSLPQEDTSQKQIKPSKPPSAQSSRKLLEQHLEIIRLKEKLEKLESEKNDLEIDLSNKTIDVGTLTDQCKQLQEQIESQVQNNKKQQQQIESMKVNQQDWNNYTKELNLSIKRLASDLDFLLASAEVDCLETNASESVCEVQEGRIKITMKKTLDKIQQISNYINQQNMMNLNSSRLQQKNERVMTEEHIFSNQFSSQESQILNTDGDISISSSNQQKIYFTTEPTLPQHQQYTQQSSDNDNTDEFVFTEESVNNNMNNNNNHNNFNQVHNTNQLDDLIMERGESEENDELSQQQQDMLEIMQLSGMLERIEENDKQNIISYITSIQKQLYQYKHTNITLNLNSMKLDRIVQKYKGKIDEIKKVFNNKNKQYETKIASLNQKYNDKCIEIKNITLLHSKQILDSNQAYTNLKIEFDNLKKLIQQNHPVSKIGELQQKLKELASDKQKLVNEKFALTQLIDEKDTIIREKDSIIALSKKAKGDNNKDNSQFYNIKRVNNDLSVTSRAAVIQRKPFLPDNSINISKSNAISLKSHIAPSIRGGGGDMVSFRKNNEYLLSEEFAEESNQDPIQMKQNNNTQRSYLQDEQSFSNENGYDNEFGIGGDHIIMSQRKMNRIEEEEDMAKEYAKMESNYINLQMKLNSFSADKQLPQKQQFQKQQQLQQQQQQSTSHSSTSSSFLGVVKKIFQ